MLELLQSLWGLVWSVAIAGWSLVQALLLGASDLLMVLHVDAPRLEGLLVGITLAWIMARRDKHPLLRAASAPLKLVLDILDLAWDQVTESAADVFDSACGVVRWSWNKKVSWVKAGWSWVMGQLVALRNKLRRGE